MSKPATSVPCPECKVPAYQPCQYKVFGFRFTFDSVHPLRSDKYAWEKEWRRFLASR